jgi:hypothetical protein
VELREYARYDGVKCGPDREVAGASYDTVVSKLPKKDRPA